MWCRGHVSPVLSCPKRGWSCRDLQQFAKMSTSWAWICMAQSSERAEAFIKCVTDHCISYISSVLGGNDHWGISKTLQRAGWWKAWALTECGTAAPWQVPETSWHGLMEPMHLATSWYANTFWFVWGSPKRLWSISEWLYFQTYFPNSVS